MSNVKKSTTSSVMSIIVNAITLWWIIKEYGAGLALAVWLLIWANNLWIASRIHKNRGD